MKKTLILSILASTALLAQQSINIDKITVTGASKSEQPLKSVTANIEVITEEEIEERHYTTVTEAISSLAGVNFVQNGGMGTTTSLLVQGFDTKHTLVLIDGVKYNDPSDVNGGAQFEHLMLSDVERIELIKGANPIWGAGAAAGVVNIVTKKAAKGLKTTADIMYGSYNTKSAKASFGYGGERYGISGGASRYLTDGFSAQAPRGSKGDDFERDGYQNTNVNLKANYKPTQNLKIDGEAYATRGLTNYDGSNPNAVQRTAYEYTMQKAGVAYTLGSHNITVQASQTQNKRDGLDSTTGVKIFKGSVKNYEVKDDFKYSWFGGLMLGAAKEDSDIRYTPAGGAEVKQNEDTRSAFAANTMSHMGLTLTQAIRYDDYSTFGSKTNAKAGAKYTVSDNLSVSTNYGTAFKAPTILQMANPFTGTTNFDLKPENIRSFDVGVSYKGASLTYFYNTVTNLIDFVGSGYTNIEGTSKLQGYEAKQSLTLAENLLASIAYTRLHAVDGSNKELQRRPHDTVTVNTDWYPTEALHIGINASYIGTRYDRNDKKTQTGGYMLFGATANYEASRHFSIYARFDNLLDKYYQSVAGYATAGRSVYVGAKMKF